MFKGVSHANGIWLFLCFTRKALKGNFMKTFNVLKKLIQVSALAAMALILANCSKDSGSGSSNRYQCYSYYNNTTVDNSYCVNSSYNYNNPYQNGSNQYVCKDSTTGYQVSNSLCANTTGTSGYYQQNGYCYQSNGQQVNQSYCYNNGTTGTCQGWHNNGQYEYYCQGNMCSGVQLYVGNLQQYYQGSRQIVTCQ